MYARIVIGLCHSARGRHAEAIGELELVSRQGARAAVLGVPQGGRLGYVLACAGRVEEAPAIMREVEAGVARGERLGVHLAYAQTGLRQFDSALDSLETAFARHETDLNYIAVDPVFDALRGQERFAELKRKLGLPR